MKQYLGATVKALDTDDPVGTFEAVISAPTLDRDGEVIVAGAFNPLPATIPIHIDHDMRVESVVARATPYYDADMLRVRGWFAGTDRAQTVRRLISEGSVNTMSVGFIAAERSKRNDGTPLITKAELIEASFVSIPSNREAQVLTARSWSGQRSARQIAADARTAVARLDLELAQITLETLSATKKPRGRAARAEADALLRKLMRS